jgi:hypothetical protein
MIKLFELAENNMATLNKPWISIIPEFRALLARDKGGPGDGSGKYKKKATREFTFIFLMYDFHSPYEHEPYDRRLELSLDNSGLTGKQVDLENDEEFQAAVEKYKDMLANSSKTLQRLRSFKAAMDSQDAFLLSIDYNERTINGGLVHNMKTQQEAMVNVPKLMTALQEIENKVKAEMNENIDMRGNAEKGFDEDPD